MQSTGQYGVSDSPQFLVARAPHIFSISHDSISLSPPVGHAHQGHHPHQHHLPHHLQAPPHHYGGHLSHQPHPSLQQIHQPQSSHASHAQHLQHAQHPQHSQHAPHAQHPAHPLAQIQQAQQQPAAHASASHQDVPQHQLQQVQQQEEQHKQLVREQQQAQEQQHAQEQMVQQLGLGDPDSPDAPSPIASRPSPTNYSKLLLSAQQDDEGLEEERGSSGGNRWPRAETLALIQIRSDLDANFRDSGVKGPLWEDVSRKLAEMGYNRSGKKCKEKFENIHKYYKKSKDGRAGRQDGKSYRFFAQLDALFGGQQTSTQVETDTAAAVLLIGNAPPLGISPADQDLNVSVQRASEVSTGVTVSKSSDDDYDGPGSSLRDNQDKKKNRKRKQIESGKSGTPKLDFFETLMKNMIDKQEAMQMRFLETMEKMEQDRQAKEDAWRRQEVARWQREHDLRAQENAIAAARDSALISFLQKVTGQNIQLSNFTTPPPTGIPPTRESEE